jgi:predicted nucleic acid-binding protein
VSERVYIETTIVGYLTDRPGGDLATQAKKQATKRWWNMQRQSFDLFTSELVAQEAASGHPEAAERRLDALAALPSLEIAGDAGVLASKITGASMIPEKYSDDALHVATATINGMDYLLTWNLSHIANATLRKKYEQVIRSEGYEPPIICTPEELLEEQQ